ncbi:TIGR00730 family Rossman fold protein [Kribbella sindirgiensis]|uniref:Cytokinin riboside 5'-monophosphate phosphoribohydrolase n=1 Tax=Kribbella sindirgiensis TaxID=1124744 RepID=A0A4V2M484_9ACTN|nr:TIGR00730 family Rossman fold protein [Kribbella sindirgiensis]TCC34892.1 TIGR00730 family Rossman fold protein [Kribbella sindirgiensis]
MTKPAAVCVFCSAQSSNPRHLALAEKLGAELARRGHTVISGGGRVSSMGALARAARAGGTRTVGIAVRAPLLDRLDLTDGDADELVVAPNLQVRNQLMIERADAFVVLAGGVGTLGEMLEVLTGRALDAHRKPLVVLDPDALFALFRAQLDLLLTQGMMSSELHRYIRWATSPDQALDLLVSSREC